MYVTMKSKDTAPLWAIEPAGKTVNALRGIAGALWIDKDNRKE